MFFTSCGELGLALHKIHEVSGLPIREIPYEDYDPIEEELHLRKTQKTLIYDTYWDVLCYYHICAQKTRLRNNGVKQKAWIDCLFTNPDQDNSDFPRLPVISEKEKEERISYFGTNAYVTELDDDVFKAGTSFDSFYCQAKYGLSDLLASFLMLWLKRCVVPTTSKEVL